MAFFIPDQTHNRAVNSLQRRAFRAHTKTLFDLFDARVRLAKSHVELAKAADDLIQSLLVAFMPYLSGAKKNNKNPHDPKSGKGFKKLLSADLKRIMKAKKWPLATVSNNATSYYCLTLRRWVEDPEDCPDIIILE
jgi:hypothetical protein